MIKKLCFESIMDITLNQKKSSNKINSNFTIDNLLSRPTQSECSAVYNKFESDYVNKSENNEINESNNSELYENGIFGEHQESTCNDDNLDTASEAASETSNSKKYLKVHILIVLSYNWNFL